MKYLFFYNTIIGKIGIAENGAEITHVFLSESEKLDNKVVNETVLRKETELIKEAANQLAEYFAGNRTSFELPLSDASGTTFQKTVWKALRNIPYGETRSYKQIAEEIGQPKAARAVGMANNRNSILIIVPCHRVIGANGKLVGYASGIDVKEKLLSMEKRVNG